MRAADRKAAFKLLREAYRIQHLDLPTLEDLQNAQDMLAGVAELLHAGRKLKVARDKNRYRIRRGQMPAVEHSMWRHLLSLRGPGADGAWIRFAGITRSLFFELYEIARLQPGFHPRMDEDGAPLPRVGAGAPLKMGDDDAMGLALRYVFGQPPPPPPPPRSAPRRPPLSRLPPPTPPRHRRAAA